MFGKLAKPGKGEGSGGRVAVPPMVVAFVAAVLAEGYRITYRGLSSLCPGGGKDGRGQHGSNRAKALPTELQPVVCRDTGEYHEKAVAAFGDDFVLEDWVSKGIIGAEDIKAAYALFVEAEEKKAAEESESED